MDDDHLRRGLARYADTTTTSPDAWARITAGGRGPKRSWIRRPAVVALPLVAALVGMVLATNQRGGTQVATTSQAEAGFLDGAQGVTDNTIKLGFIVNVGADNFFTAGGQATGETPAAGGWSYGDEKKQAQALVDDLNARGGIAGRQVVPVFAHMRWTQKFGPESEYAETCAKLTEDEKVFAAITGETIAVDTTLASCFAEHHTLLISLPLVPGDEEFLRLVEPWYRIPSTKTDSRMWRAMIADLKRNGFFGSDARVGMVVGGQSSTHRVAEEVVKPAVEAAGAQVVDSVVMGFGGRGGADQAAMSSAVLKFKQKNVTHVLFVPTFDLAYAFLKMSADQEFRPRFAIESTFQPSATTFFVYTPDQLKGAAGIGWRPQYDQRDDSRLPYSAQEQRCFKIMRAAGVEVTDRDNPLGALVHCENLWLFEAAAKKAGRQLTARTWLDGLRSLGTSHPSVLTAGLDLSTGRADASTVHRSIVFDDACECFLYDGKVARDAAR